MGLLLQLLKILLFHVLVLSRDLLSSRFDVMRSISISLVFFLRVKEYTIFTSNETNMFLIAKFHTLHSRFGQRVLIVPS